jgi:hypothetical protein
MNQYIGSLLLCKALPLTSNLVKALSFKQITETDGLLYSKLCEKEVNYLNSKDIHDKIQNKMQACIYGKESPLKGMRINYFLAICNVAEYNAMLLAKSEEKLKENK